MVSDAAASVLCSHLLSLSSHPRLSHEKRTRALQGSTYLVAPAVHPQFLLTSLGKGKREQSLLYLCPVSCLRWPGKASSVVTSTYNDQGQRTHVLRCLQARRESMSTSGGPHTPTECACDLCQLHGKQRHRQQAAGQTGLSSFCGLLFTPGGT